MTQTASSSYTYINGTLALPCGAPRCWVLTTIQAPCGAYRCEGHLDSHLIQCKTGR